MNLIIFEDCHFCGSSSLGTGSVVATPDQTLEEVGVAQEPVVCLVILITLKALELYTSQFLLAPEPGNLKFYLPYPPTNSDGDNNTAGSSVCKVELSVARVSLQKV